MAQTAPSPKPIPIFTQLVGEAVLIRFGLNSCGSMTHSTVTIPIRRREIPPALGRRSVRRLGRGVASGMSTSALRRAVNPAATRRRIFKTSTSSRSRRQWLCWPSADWVFWPAAARPDVRRLKNRVTAGDPSLGRPLLFDARPVVTDAPRTLETAITRHRIDLPIFCETAKAYPCFTL